MIDDQDYRLCQSFGTLTKFMMQKQFLDFSESLNQLWQSVKPCQSVVILFTFHVLSDGVTSGSKSSVELLVSLKIGLPLFSERTLRRTDLP